MKGSISGDVPDRYYGSVSRPSLMIDLKPELSASYPVGNTDPLSASYAIGRGCELLVDESVDRLHKHINARMAGRRN